MAVENEEAPAADDSWAALETALNAPEEVVPAEAAPEAPAEAVVESTETKAGKARDEAGRFAKAKADAAAKPPVVETAKTPVSAPGEVTPPKPAEVPSAFRPPQAWKPAAREDWAKVPPVVQEEINRREREVAVSMQQSAAVRQQWGQFEQVVSPYVGMIQAEGGDVMGAIANLLQTSAALRTAPIPHRAQMIADIVRQFGVPIEALDAALSGQSPPQGQQQAQQFDPRALVSQAKQEMMRELQQQRAQSAGNKASQDIETFGQSKDFFEDLREDMADLLEVATKRGLQLSLEDAYNRAALLNPDVSKVLEQRKAASQANAQQASTQRAKAAASSVRSQPSGVSAPQSDDIGSHLEAAWAKASGR